MSNRQHSSITCTLTSGYDLTIRGPENGNPSTGASPISNFTIARRDPDLFWLRVFGCDPFRGHLRARDQRQDPRGEAIEFVKTRVAGCLCLEGVKGLGDLRMVRRGGKGILQCFQNHGPFGLAVLPQILLTQGSQENCLGFQGSHLNMDNISLGPKVNSYLIAHIPLLVLRF